MPASFLTFECFHVVVYFSYLLFLQHDAMLALYMLSSCVRLSGFPSHVCIVPKCRNTQTTP